MQDDKVARARALAKHWARQERDFYQSADYSRLTPEELIRLAESEDPMSSSELEALDYAWHECFGEWLCETEDGDGPAAEPNGTPAQELPADDAMLSMADVLRFTSLSKSTLKRRVLDKTFPSPLRPSTRRIGWKACEVKDWLEQLETGRRRAADSFLIENIVYRSVQM